MMTERITELLDAIEQMIPSGGTVALRREVRPDDFAALDELRELLTSATANSVGPQDPDPVGLRESDRQSSESRGLGSASALEVEAAEAFVESIRHSGRGALKGSTRRDGLSDSVEIEDALDIFDRQIDHILGWLTVRLASATKPEASPSPESESENV